MTKEQQGAQAQLISLRIPVQLKNLVHIIAKNKKWTQSQQIIQSVEDSFTLQKVVAAVSEHLAAEPPLFAIPGWQPSRERCMEYIFDAVESAVAEQGYIVESNYVTELYQQSLEEEPVKRAAPLKIIEVDGVDYTMMSIRFPKQVKESIEALASANQATQSQQICQCVQEGLELQNAIHAIAECLAENPPVFATEGWLPSPERCLEFLGEAVMKTIAADEAKRQA